MSIKLRLLVAITDNNTIGVNNSFVTYITGQMKRFRDETVKTPVIMGRKTQDYINFPLDERICITISSDKKNVIDGFIHAGNIKDAISIATQYAVKYKSKHVSIMGGQSIFEQFLPFVDEIFITEVYTDTPGDRYFPELNILEWTPGKREDHDVDANNEHPYSFITYYRKNPNELHIS